VSTLLGPERRTRLLAILERDGAIRLDPAGDELGVSVMTVRRDLADLEAEGLVRRVRGGAVAALSAQSFGERSATRASTKERIARKAAALLPDSGTIALDASTTTGMLVAEFGAERDLTVASNSYDVAESARRAAGIRALLVGGEREERTGSFVGPMAARAAAQLSYRVFFASAAAVHPEFGSSEVTLEEAEIKTVFAANAERTVLLVDASKLDQRATATALAWDSIDVMVTELDPANARLDPYRALVDLL
jgi:DeoR family glycerol-3-phosphate regulon repressor